MDGRPGTPLSVPEVVEESGRTPQTPDPSWSKTEETGGRVVTCTLASDGTEVIPGRPIVETSRGLSSWLFLEVLTPVRLESFHTSQKVSHLPTRRHVSGTGTEGEKVGKV